MASVSFSILAAFLFLSSLALLRLAYDVAIPWRSAFGEFSLLEMKHQLDACSCLLPGILGCVTSVSAAIALHIVSLNPQSDRSLFYNIALYLHRMNARCRGLCCYIWFQMRCRDVCQAQAKVLSEVLKQNSGAEYCRAHAMGAGIRVVDFTRQVPIVHYADIEEQIKRMQEGKQGVLTTMSISHFVSTCAPGGKRQVWPVIKGSQVRSTFLWFHELFQRGWVTLRPVARLSHLQDPDDDGAFPKARYPNPTHCDFFASPKEAYLIRDEWTACYIQALFALASPELEGIEYGTNQRCALFWQLIRENWSHLCYQIQQSHISPQVPLPPQVAQSLVLKGSPKRPEAKRRDGGRLGRPSPADLASLHLCRCE